MEILFTFYPISVIYICVILITIIFYFNYYIMISILCILSMLNIISIQPVLDKIDVWINETCKARIKKIKQNIHDTFIVKGNLINDKQSIYILHPHGIFSLSHVFHSGTTITNWPYRNIKGVVHILIQKMPFLKDFLGDINCVESSYSSMKEELKTGISLSVCLGNFTEGKYDSDHHITAIVKKRNGIFKMAIETGVNIVPVITYGEQSTFKQMYTFGILEYISEKIGIQLNCPCISSFKKWLSIYDKPFEEKIETYIGTPINVGSPRIPTLEEIEELKKQYMDSLQKLYKETHPIKYDEEMTFV